MFNMSIVLLANPSMQDGKMGQNYLVKGLGDYGSEFLK